MKNIISILSGIIGIMIMFFPIFIAFYTFNFWYLFLFFVTVVIAKVFMHLIETLLK